MILSLPELPMSVNLNLGDEPLTVGEPRKVSCDSPEAPNADLTLHFERRNVSITRLLQDKVHIFADALMAELSWFPQSVFNLIVDRQRHNSSLVVSLIPDEGYRNTQVTCKGSTVSSA